MTGYRRKRLALALAAVSALAVAATSTGAPAAKTVPSHRPTVAPNAQERRLAQRLRNSGVKGSLHGIAMSGTTTLRVRVNRSIKTGRVTAVAVSNSQQTNGSVFRHRSAEIPPDSLVIAAVNDRDELVWPTAVADPTVERAESADPKGTLHGRAAHRPSATVTVSIPNDPAITRLRVFASDPSGSGGLTALDTVAVPAAGPAPAWATRSNVLADNRVDIAILGDGYTAAEQSKLATDAQAAFDGLVGESPFSEYRPYFTLHTILTVSAQSGADHPERQPATFVNTAFDAAYQCQGIDRTICIDQSKVEAALAGFGSTERDIVLVMVNDPTYGGSGGSVAVASTASDSLELVRHELGHTFGLLGDEYSTSPPSCDLAADRYANLTTQTVRASVKWNAWIASSTPVPTTTSSNGLPGLYDGGNYCTAGVYRPTYNSKMRSLGQPYEQVNSEQLVRRIYDVVSPVDAVSPSIGAVDIGTSRSFTVTPLHPQTHNLGIEWRLDGALVGTSAAYTANANGLGSGTHTLSVRVSDPTPFVRNDPQGLLVDTAEWTLVHSNDAFNDAQVLSGATGTATGSNVTATSEPGEPNHATITGGTSIWYRWTAPASGTVTLDTFGSDFDTLIAAYTGSTVSALTPIVGNDDDGTAQSRIGPFTVTSGTTYWIAVDGFQGARGNVVLNWSSRTAKAPLTPLAGKLVP